MNAKKTFKSEQHAEGYQLWLSEQTVKTPEGAEMIVPTLALANVLVTDLEAEKITLPLQITYTALDQKHENPVLDILHLLHHDSLLYWPNESEEQAAFFDKNISPVLRFISSKTNCILTPSRDLSAPQIPESLLICAENQLKNLNVFELISFREIASVLGSYLLAELVCEAEIEISEAVKLSLIEQHYQRAQWGTTDTHEEVEAELIKALEECVAYLKLCRRSPASTRDQGSI